MTQARCHCGGAVVEVRTLPVEVTECNCSICRRYGVLWAYHPLAEVRLPSPGLTDTYEWAERSIAFHRCRTCGCVTHWAPNDDRDRVGINARLFDPSVLEAARVRHLDGASTECYLD